MHEDLMMDRKNRDWKKEGIKEGTLYLCTKHNHHEKEKRI